MMTCALILFTGCSSDDSGDSGLTANPPKLSVLPSIPEENDAITTQDEAKALLESIDGVLSVVNSDVSNLIKFELKKNKNTKQSDGSYKWNFKDKTQDSIKFSSDGKHGSTSKVANEYQNIFTVGDRGKRTIVRNTTFALTDDYTDPTTKILAGSKSERKVDLYAEATVKSVDDGGYATSYKEKGRHREAFAYGLTVIADGKGGKIVVTAKYDLSYAIMFPEDVCPAAKVSGSVKVYGRDESAALYSQDIIDKEEFEELFAYSLEKNEDWE